MSDGNVKPMKALRAAYGDGVTKLAATNDKIVVCDADLSNATMTMTFAKAYPQRFFDFGIAEANMMCAAAGMAYEGMIPFVSSFALFGSGRAFEQVRNSVAYVKANVKLALTHAGISVGEDGGSHQSIEDIALMRVLPNMTIFAPCDAIEMEKALAAAVAIDGPVFIRGARPPSAIVTDEKTPFIPGKANVLREGRDIALFSMGLCIPECLEAAEALRADGIDAAVVNFHTIKPFDAETAVSWAKKVKAVVAVEEHSVIGGLGSAVAEAIAGCAAFPFARLGVQDKFGQSGSPKQLFAEYGIDSGSIAKQAKKMLGK